MKLTIFVFYMILCLSCSSQKILYIYSPDKTQCITVFTRGTLRHVINGKHNEIATLNYLKLDITGTTELSDAIYICWPKEDQRGEIIIPKTLIIENQLDSSLYIFSSNLPEDDRGIPRPTKFAQEGCTSIGFLYRAPFPKGSAFVEFE